MIGNVVAAVVVAKWDGEFDAALWNATSPSAAASAAGTNVPGGALVGLAPSLWKKSV
jgi:hypothetical protein